MVARPTADSVIRTHTMCTFRYFYFAYTYTGVRTRYTATQSRIIIIILSRVEAGVRLNNRIGQKNKIKNGVIVALFYSSSFGPRRKNQTMNTFSAIGEIESNHY